MSSNSPHKNLWRLNSIIEEMLKLNFNNFEFLVTTSYSNWISTIKENVNQDNIKKHLKLIGNVSTSNIDELYKRSNALLILSDLESFSNNYMEAWKAGKPIISSNRDFARSICKDSAVYVESHNPPEIAKVIINLINSDELQRTLVEKGKELLSSLPSQEARLQLIVKKILKIKNELKL